MSDSQGNALNEKKPTILICGKTGVGKSSLIQAITHTGTVPDSAISNSESCTKGFVVYETEAAVFIDAEGFEPGMQIEDYAEFILKEMRNRVDSGEISQVVTSIWYCIDAIGARIQEGDARFIQKIEQSRWTKKIKVIITKSELLRDKQRKEFDEQLRNLISPEHIVYVSSHRADGLNRLTQFIEQDAHDAGIEAKAQLDAYYEELRKKWEQRIDGEADAIIRWGAGRAAAIAVLPVPLADVAPLVVNEAYMIYKLGALYGYSVTKSILSMLGGVAGGSLCGKLIASFFPGLKIAIAAGVTFGVGKAAKSFFRSGMQLSMEELKEQYKKGEKEAKGINWKENKASNTDEL